MIPERAARVRAIREVWTGGAYERIAALFAPLTDALVGDMDLAGRRVLDAATGTGNTALAAARAGAQVCAFDLTPRLLEIAALRARAEGLEIELVEGDLLAFPYPDDSFDVVLSTFGAFTADDPARCAGELVRVCRPDGRIVLTAWAREGLFAVLSAAVAELHPDAVDRGRADPRAWADPEGLARIFTGHDVRVEVETRTAWLPFPSVADGLALLEDAFGPTRRQRAAVVAASAGQDRDGWEQVRALVLRRWADLARPAADGIELPAAYGVAVITPAAPRG